MKRKLFITALVCIAALIASCVAVFGYANQYPPIDENNDTIFISHGYKYNVDNSRTAEITSSTLTDGQLVLGGTVYALGEKYHIDQYLRVSNNYEELDPDDYFILNGKKYGFHIIGVSAITENMFDPAPADEQWLSNNLTVELVPLKEPEDVKFTGETTLTVKVGDDIMSNDGITANDNGKDLTYLIDGEKVDTSKPCTHTYSWSISGMSGNLVTFERKIIVTKEDAPGTDLVDVVFSGKKTVTVKVGDDIMSNDGITANDNGEDITYMIGGKKVDTSVPAEITYTWYITGKNGNKVSFTRTFIIEAEEEPPVQVYKDVVFKGEKTITVYVGDKIMSNKGITVNDNGDDLTYLIEGEIVDTSKPGKHTYSWYIAGMNGNLVTFERVIIVKEKPSEQTKPKAKKVTTTATIKGVGKISAKAASGTLYQKKGKIIAKHAKGTKVTFKAYGNKFKYWQKKVNGKYKKYSKKRTISVKDKTNTVYRAVFKK